MEQNNSSDMLTLRDHCRWLLLPTAAWTQCWCSLTHTAIWLYVLLAHLLLSIFLWWVLIRKHYCLRNKSEEKIWSWVWPFYCRHNDPSHASMLYIFPPRSRKLLGLGAFGVHLTPLKCRLHLVCAIWAHKPLARWLQYHLLNSWILWVLNLPESGCDAIFGLWRLKGACDLYQLLDKSTSTSPCYLIHVKVFSAQILSYNDWKHFTTDICGASHHMSLHKISFF
jgi:hypothetical protein